MPKPSLFIGSSTEGLEFARAIRTKLDSSAEIVLWEDEMFTLGSTVIEGLINSASQFDFAIMVLTCDDIINSRNVEAFGPRDNVLFELGLFMGTLGRERCFVVQQADNAIKVPSDLSGLITAKYYWPREDNKYESAVGSACDIIRRRISNLGFNERKTQKKLAIVEEEQLNQKKNIEALSFIISHFVPKYEIEHLKKLISNGEFNYELHEGLKREIRHLLDMQFIQKKRDFAFASLPNNGDLKEYFEVTKMGKDFLKMRNDFEGVNKGSY